MENNTINHSEREHALLSPSSAHRWMNCTRAPHFEEQFPDSESEAAREGTLAHEVCESLLRGLEPSPEGLQDEQMMQYARGYVEYVEAIKNSYQNPHVSIEARLSLDPYVPMGKGTADCIIIGGEDLHVVDFKYGQGVRVECKENPQMMIYALGAYESYKMIYRGAIKNVIMHIYQPRMGNVGEYSMPLRDLLLWGDDVLTPKAREAFNGTGTFVPGDWCLFCRGGGACKARLEEEMRVFEEVTAEVDDKSNRADGAMLARWLDAAKRISDTLTAVQEYALHEAQQRSGAVPGYKVVEKRTIRRWKDEGATIAELTALGYDEGQLLNKKLKGIGDITKLLKGTDVDVNKYLYKPKGAPEMAPISDKRTEMVTIEQLFNN